MPAQLITPVRAEGAIDRRRLLGLLLAAAAAGAAGPALAKDGREGGDDHGGRGEGGRGDDHGGRGDDGRDDDHGGRDDDDDDKDDDRREDRDDDDKSGHGRGPEAEKSANGVLRLRYRDGWTEIIDAERIEVRDPEGRVIVRRRLNDEDRRRLRRYLAGGA